MVESLQYQESPSEQNRDKTSWEKVDFKVDLKSDKSWLLITSTKIGIKKSQKVNFFIQVLN